MNDISSALQSRNVDDSATLEVKISGTDRTKKNLEIGRRKSGAGC